MLDQAGILNTNRKSHFLSWPLDVSLLLLLLFFFSEFRELCLHANVLSLLQKGKSNIQLNLECVPHAQLM